MDGVTRNATCIVYRYWLNAARRARLANRKGRKFTG
jgi:hypothetical protein